MLAVCIIITNGELPDRLLPGLADTELLTRCRQAGVVVSCGFKTRVIRIPIA